MKTYVFAKSRRGFEHWLHSIHQTYVESLKKSGNFSKDAQVEALTKAKNKVLSQTGSDIKDYISSNYGDFNNWLELWFNIFNLVATQWYCIRASKLKSGVAFVLKIH